MMKTKGKLLAMVIVLIPLAALADQAEGGGQGNAAKQGQNASDITGSAVSDPNAIYIKWGDTVEVRRGVRTIENINLESGSYQVQGATGTVEKFGSSVTYTPSGRPPLSCPSTGDPEIFGPCKLG